jgi:hypothetical protein
MIHEPWTATSMLIAAPTAPLLLAVTVNSRLGPGPGRGGRRPRRCSGNAFRVHPPGAPADPRGALSTLSLDAAKITVIAAAGALAWGGLALALGAVLAGALLAIRRLQRRRSTARPGA